MKPDKPGLYWVRLVGSAEFNAVGLIHGEAPYLRVSRVIETYSGKTFSEWDVVEWGPEIVPPDAS